MDMKQPQIDMANVHMVDESIVITASTILPPGNSFEGALGFAKEYREAGLTPIFFADMESKTIFVSCEELMQSTIH